MYKKIGLTFFVIIASSAAQSQPAVTLGQAVECAGMSASFSGRFPKPTRQDTEIMEELRLIVREIHDSSYSTAMRMGIEQGKTSSEVAKLMIPIMFGADQQDPNEVWASIRKSCEQQFLSAKTKQMMQKRNAKP